MKISIKISRIEVTNLLHYLLRSNIAEMKDEGREKSDGLSSQMMIVLVFQK